MTAKIETPMEPKGTADQQTRQLYTYLFRLSENLNVIFSTLSDRKEGESAEQQVAGGETDLQVLLMKAVREIEEENRTIADALNAHETAPLYPLSI